MKNFKKLMIKSIKNRFLWNIFGELYFFILINQILYLMNGVIKIQKNKFLKI